MTISLTCSPAQNWHPDHRMKDKKSIAIVVLAAITAGIGIYTIVNNQSKLSAYGDLKGKHANVSDERKALTQKLQTMTDARNALDTEATQLQTDLGATQINVQSLQQQKTVLEENIKENDLKFVAELSQKDEALKKIGEDLIGKTAELEKAIKDLETTMAAEVKAKAELGTAMKDLGQEQQALADLKTKSDVAMAESKKMIVELESKYDGLNQAKGALEEQIKNLNADIEATSEKLETSVADRVFLERELVRLQEEKSELVRKMNDIHYIAARYKEVRYDLSVAKREDWKRRGVGVYARRKTIIEQNAELRGKKPPVLANNPAPTLPVPEKIRVELTSDGRVKINGKIIEPDSKPETKKEEPAPKTGAGASNPVAPKKVSSQD